MDSSGIQSIELEGHSGAVRCVTFSPSDQIIASASYDKTVRFWNAQSGDQIAVLGDRDSVMSVAFSPDGASIASASVDGTIKVWGVVSREEITTFREVKQVNSVAFSPDGALLASGSDDYAVRLWDVQSGTCITTMKGHTHRVKCVAFSPDGQTIASGSKDKTIRLWQVQSGAHLATLQHHEDDVKSVVFSPAGNFLASCSYDKTIVLWYYTTNAPIVKLQGHTDRVISIAVSPDCKCLASASNDGTVQLWDVASRSHLATFKTHSDQVWSVSFSADGYQLASASKDQTVKLWRLPKQFITKTPRSSSNQEDTNPLPSSTLRLHNDITSLISSAGSTLIGFGGSGDVFSATHQDIGKVALKRTRKFLDDASARRFLREVNLWRSVSHQYILPCLGMCEFDTIVYVVSPFIENGDLRSCISNGTPFNRTRIIYEVAQALAHLHHRGIIHGDVKAQNVLLSSGRSALLCDFGLAKALDSMMTSTENKGAGSVRWMAPELFMHEPRSMASDVYSFGITIAEILSGETPYTEFKHNIGVSRHVDSGGRPPKVPGQSPEGKSYSVLWDTAEKCWSKEAKDRPYMAQVLAMLSLLAQEKN